MLDGRNEGEMDNDGSSLGIVDGTLDGRAEGLILKLG